MPMQESNRKHHWDDYSSLHAGVCLSDVELRDLQQTLTGMLQDIVMVCNKYQIPYFLVGGTALGAMRHQGFIPWDDDIDIAMFRRDYEHFLSCFDADMADKYYVQSPEYTDGYPSLIPRIRARGNVVRSREDLWTDEAHSGAWVDLFVIENTFDNKILRFCHGIMSLCLGGILACRKTFATRKALQPFIVRKSKYARKVLLRSLIGGCLGWIPVNWLRKMANGCNRMCKCNSGKFVTIPTGHWRFFGDMYARVDFSGTRMAEFERIPCRIPASVEKYLSHCYGAWQKIPPESGREVHFFCVFSLDKKIENSVS